MSFQLRKKIFCYDLINPPAQDRKSNIDLNLVNSNYIGITKEEVSFGTVYSLKIADPLTVGFTSSEQSILENEFKNLMLALNLNHHRVCIDDANIDFSSFDVTPVVPESTSSTERIGNMVRVNLTDTIVIRDEVATVIGFTGEIDERLVIDTFCRLNKLKRFVISGSSSRTAVNLDSSIKDYENAMRDNQKLFKFKHLYNALEKITNVDGTDRSGPDLDNQVYILSGTSITDIEAWRRFYDRIKHVQRNQVDVIRYYNGIQSLTDDLLKIRKCFQTIILSKL